MVVAAISYLVENGPPGSAIVSRESNKLPANYKKLDICNTSSESLLIERWDKCYWLGLCSLKFGDGFGVRVVYGPTQPPASVWIAECSTGPSPMPSQYDCDIKLPVESK
jgi:hypothetical protein